MATFFGGNLAGPSEMGEMLSSGLKAGMEARAAQKSKQLDALFAKHTDASGNLNEHGFVKDATAAGLGRAEIEQAAQYHTQQTSTALANESARRQLQFMKVDPNAAGRNEAQYGEPSVQVSAPKQDAPDTTGFTVAPETWKPNAVKPSDFLTGQPMSQKAPEASSLPQTAATVRQGEELTSQPVQGDELTMDKVLEWLHSGNKAQVAKGQQAIGMQGKAVDGVWGSQTAKAFLDAAHANGWKSWGGAEQATSPAQVTPAEDGSVTITANAPSYNPADYSGMAPSDTGATFSTAPDNRSFLQKIEDTEQPMGLGSGTSRMPPAPDLRNADPSEVAGLAKVLRMQLNYKGDDVPGPNMQKAFNQLWESEFGKVLAKQPIGWVTGSDGKPDMNKTIQAQQAWEGEVRSFPSTMADKIQSWVKEGNVTIPGEKLTQQGTALSNKGKANELARTTDSTLGVDASIMDPAQLKEIRDRMGKWKTLATIAKHGGGEGAVGQESYRTTVEKFGQLAEGIAPTMEGSRLVQRISQQAGPWQSYLQEGNVKEGVRQYFLAQSMGTAAQRKAALDEMLGTLRESIANDAESYSARNGAMVGNNARNALKFDVGGADKGASGPAPTGKTTKSGNPALAF